jgi:DNA-binding transcriptional MerR regulator
MMVDVFNETHPQKRYRIGDVAKLVDVKPYVIRYWETEFKSFLGPERTDGGQKLYSTRDVETIFNIKKLLYSEGFNISGARKKLKEFKSLKDQPKTNVPVGILEVVRQELHDIRSDLNKIMDSINNVL